jgi:hypothetical protein
MIKGKSHSGHNGQLLTLKRQSKQARHAGKMQRVEPQPDVRAECVMLPASPSWAASGALEERRK